MPYHRRHLTTEQQQQHRADRVQRVAEARAQGKSTREIAELEGVSQALVRKDIAKAGEHQCSPETVIGRDGKQYPTQHIRKIRSNGCVNAVFADPAADLLRIFRMP